MFTKVALLLSLGWALAAAEPPYAYKVIAAVIVAEAGGEGENGMSAVAEVIRERGQRLKMTPFQVVSAKKAFSCLNSTSPARLIRKQQQQEKVYAYALALADCLYHAPQNLPNATNKATHFTRKEEKPYWAKGHKPVAVIGAHAFYRLKL